MYLFNSSQQTLKEGKAYVIILVFSKPGLKRGQGRQMPSGQRLKQKPVLLNE